MKKLLILLFAFVAISCTDEQPTEPSYGGAFERLLGNWCLIHEYDGWGKSKDFPFSNRPFISFRSDTSYIIYKPDGNIFEEMRFDYKIDQSIVSDSSWVIIAPKGTSGYDGDRWVTEFRNDTLFMVYDANDATNWILKRIR
jgi:hypothetical protein